MRKSLFNRIKKRAVYTIHSFKEDSRFSICYAFLRVSSELAGRLGFTSVASKFSAKKDDWILGFLENNLSEVIKECSGFAENGEYESNAPIWICWWDGEENAPIIVQKCIESIRNNAGNHPVKMITKYNYQDFVEIPSYILNNMHNGNMKLAHLADYIRVSLLHEHGGLWLDATVYCSKQISEMCFTNSFFTCKSEPRPCGYISRMRWTTFVLGGWKGNTVYYCLQRALEHYWKQNEIAVDYLFFDYIIELMYNNIPFIQEKIDNLQYNNLHRDDLQAAMNSAVPAKDMSNILNEDTFLYKLSWREDYELETVDGLPSVYAYFVSS